MATRRERVVLDLEDNFSTPMARAAAATAVLDRSLNHFGNTTRRAGPDIDRFSGRGRLLADAALTLGPALVPLGAATIPALTGSIAALGAAAGGIGTAVLAFQGLGDAVSSIKAYELEPTAKNLQAMRVE